MKETLDNFISENQNGIILLDSPTGFGKTHSVIQILKEFIQGTSHQELKRIFFVTNLKTNLPYNELYESLTDEEKKRCLVAKSYEENIVEKWKIAKKLFKIPTDIKASKVFKNLDGDVDVLLELIEHNELEKTNKAINGFHNKIMTITEPAFREFVCENYIYGKSIAEKKEFIKKNEWFRILYPICEIEKYKVVFLTTSKYFSPINTFYRLPFYIYEDEIINNSLTIIDEFDASKRYILNQIVENSLKINVDIVKLFIDIHYTLANLEFPEILSKLSSSEKDNIDENSKFKSSKDIIQENKNIFNKVYQELNLNLLLKSNEFNSKKVFLFNDGNYITIFKDNSKKHLYLKVDNNDKFLKINAKSSKSSKDAPLNKLLNKINYCLKFFATGISFLAEDYQNFKNNVIRNRNENKYTQEEALATIFSIFNISEKNRQYLEQLISLSSFNSPNEERSDIRKGFQFTEVEDSEYHDLQSVIHQYNFKTTPENLLIKIATKSKLIGVSATATLPTVIGNFDINYIEQSLGELYCHIKDDDKSRIVSEFNDSQKLYNNSEISLHTELIDDLNVFSDKEKSIEILKKIYPETTIEKYCSKLENKDFDEYYFLICCKLAYIYYLIEINNIKSTIAFLNRLPKTNDPKLNISLLEEMFEDINRDNKLDSINVFYVKSENFDDEMDDVYSKLAKGETCFVITTYQTIGSGKNIQYPIGDYDNSRVIINDKKRMEKDFEAIYVETPRNLIQRLTYESEDIYKDLSIYLFQQQSLQLAEKLTDSHYRQNVINGFRRAFFKNSNTPMFNKNSDICCHTAQLVIQAVGRICRCKNKNKNIFIFSDIEIVDRFKRISNILDKRLYNREFLSLYNQNIQYCLNNNIIEMSRINKNAYITIKRCAYTLRSSKQLVDEWKSLRDYVLKNPTNDTERMLDKYCDLYFSFDAKLSGYSYSYDCRHNLTKIKLNTQEDMSQVSATDCELPILLNIPCIEKAFKDNGYIGTWKRGNHIMTPSLYNQIYKGALGEVAGKSIIESETGWDLKDLEDYKKYELFDYQIKGKNVYIDFKHWNEFIVDTENYIEKINRKLDRVGGEKAIIINILKRGDHTPHMNIRENILQIPYLIDDDNDICQEMIDEISNFIQ